MPTPTKSNKAKGKKPYYTLTENYGNWFITRYEDAFVVMCTQEKNARLITRALNLYKSIKLGDVCRDNRKGMRG